MNVNVFSVKAKIKDDGTAVAEGGGSNVSIAGSRNRVCCFFAQERM